MVVANIVIKKIETDSTGQMLTVTADVDAGNGIVEVVFNTMIASMSGLTDAEVQEMFRGAIQDIITQKAKAEMDVENGQWKRTEAFVGMRYDLEV